MRLTWRSYIIGMHNPTIHGLAIVKAWIKLYYKLPSPKEAFCIVFHDIGYLWQNKIDGPEDKHPEFGARLCGLMGKSYFEMCICHSRVYAKKYTLDLSKLGYADKASLLMLPNWLFKNMIWIGGEASEYHRTTKTRKWGYPINVCLIKADYQKWLSENLLVGGVKT